MNSKVEYSGLPSDDGNLTLSIDGDSERLERASFLDEKFEKQLLRNSSRNIVLIVLPWLFTAGLSIALILSHLSPKRACAEDDMEKYCESTMTCR